MAHMGLIFLIWCLAITLRFLHVVIKEFTAPYNSAADPVWAVAWIFSCGFFVLAAALLPPRVRQSIWLLPLLAGIVVISLSGSWFPTLLALWLLLMCAAIGVAVLQKLVGTGYSIIEYVVCGIPIGIGVISLAMFVFGLLGQLTTTTIWVFLLIVSAGSFKLWKPNISISFRGSGLATENVLVYTIMGSVAFVYLLWAVAPEIQYDALNYHLAVPATYLQNGRIVEIRFFHAYFARLIELFLTACLAVGGPATAKMWVFFISICGAMGVYALGYSTVDTRVGLWAAALFITTPLVGWLFGTAYTDNIVTLFVTSSFIALVRWEDSRKQGWLYTAALLAGVAAGSKVNVILAYVLVAAIVILQILMAPSTKFIHKIRTLAVAAFAASLFVVPTYALTYSFTGNPVFPLLNSIFKSPKWNLDTAIMNASDYGLPMTVSSLIRFPFRLTFDTIRFGDALPRGGAGVALLFAFPFGLFLLPRTRMASRLLIIGAAGYLLSLFYTMQYARYYIMILPLVAVIGMAALWYLTPPSVSRWLPAALLVIIIVQPLVHSLQFWNIQERFPTALAFGRENKEAFLRRALPGYAAAMYLNTLTGQKDTVLGVGTESLRFYLHAQLLTWTLSLYGDPVRSLADMHPGEALATSIKRLGVTYLFVVRDATKNPVPEYPYLDKTFLQSYATPIFQDKYVLVYQLL
jgi:4-amino-4-deoxy-L-arabinose transferase-like glycosyltransferase